VPVRQSRTSSPAWKERNRLCFLKEYVCYVLLPQFHVNPDDSWLGYVDDGRFRLVQILVRVPPLLLSVTGHVITELATQCVRHAGCWRRPIAIPTVPPDKHELGHRCRTRGQGCRAVAPTVRMTRSLEVRPVEVGCLSDSYAFCFTLATLKTGIDLLDAPETYKSTDKLLYTRSGRCQGRFSSDSALETRKWGRGERRRGVGGFSRWIAVRLHSRSGWGE